MAEESNAEVVYVQDIVYVKIEKGITSPMMQRIPLTDAVTSPQMTAIPETLPTANVTPTNSIAYSGSTSNDTNKGSG